MPHECLFGWPPSISTLYPFGTDTIVHIPPVQQLNKLAPRGMRFCLLKPLMSGGWLLWDPKSDRMIQLASIIFRRFQPPATSNTRESKGSLSHIVNRARLGNVPTEKYFNNKNAAIDPLPLTKDVSLRGNFIYPKDHKYKINI
ncbi:hypothetical protein O181_088890 [Austropuccinia psidii MF-1]|uniref:Uncharacterized protein n=1 Tax=Austropuccinia psidii MF-1 TaxID=1389203 RepID=A0A9Q3ISR1_9BASI|nr:hypothetical protein [Austropuccinia psidii MF-1]